MKLEWGAQTNSTALLPKGWGVLIHCCSPGQQSPPQIPAQCQRIDAFELWWCRRLLRVPWTARRSNQSILKEIHPEYSLKDCCRSSSTVATWRKELTHWKKTLMLGNMRAGEEGDKRGWEVRQHHWFNGHELWERVKDRGASRTAVHGVAKSQKQLSNWTTTV